MNYTLYIYVDPSVSQEIKDIYINNATRHNSIVDLYLENESKEDVCFDAGFDLICPENITVTNNSCMVDHKIKCCMKKGAMYVGYYLYCRSSTCLKTPFRLANSVGIIDSGYRGNIKANFDVLKTDLNVDLNLDLKFMEEVRYVQICPSSLDIPMRIVIVDDIALLGGKTTRGTGGFGSTGL